MQFIISPIAFVNNSRIDIEDDQWGSIISTIKLDENINIAAIKGINEFSHLEIIFYFNKVSDDKIQFEARHPRNNTKYPEVGIFAQRGKNRPNKLGVTIVELLQVEDNRIIVKGLDAIDGTPIIDIKPVMKEFLPKGEVSQPNWSVSLMERYWEE
ncbi:SAM-dependent methyltransferase [Rummeliibacillus sp. NPDC094406]|uniref:SAM-dependent methyltransferase n=1 Tax=Rummeliibacillus sp. NPDC094406 TaxID=3364511 RepID=UPI0038233E56